MSFLFGPQPVKVVSNQRAFRSTLQTDTEMFQRLAPESFTGYTRLDRGPDRYVKTDRQTPAAFFKFLHHVLYPKLTYFTYISPKFARDDH